jgi:hypothetical protein
MRVLEFHRIPFDQVDWQLLDSYADRVVMQRRGWLEFVQAITGGEIVIAQIEQDGQTAGFFSGILFRRCGVPILGSPFRGWTTAYMGFQPPPRHPPHRCARRARTVRVSSARLPALRGD